MPGPVPIPSDATPDLQKALRQIEVRLAALEGKEDPASILPDATKKKSLEDRVAELENPIPGPEWSTMVGDGLLHASGLTPDTYPNAGLGHERVLHADAAWKRPIGGLVQEVPATLRGINATRLVEVLADLALAGSLGATGAFLKDLLVTGSIHVRGRRRSDDENIIKLIAPAGGSGGLAPSAVSGMKAWWTGDTEVYNVADTTLALDGETIAQWKDQSGNAFHVVESTNKPTYQTNEVNGHNIIRFDGTNDKLSTSVAVSNLVANNAKTIFMVVKIVTGATRGLYYADDNVSAQNAIGASWDQTNIESLNWDGSADIAEKAAAATTWHIHTYLHSGGTLYSGVSDTRTASMGSVASGNTSVLTQIFNIGRSRGAFGAFDLADMSVFNVAVPESSRQQIETYYASRYSVTLPYSVTTYGNVDIILIEDDSGGEIFRISNTGDVFIKGVQLTVP